MLGFELIKLADLLVASRFSMRSLSSEFTDDASDVGSTTSCLKVSCVFSISSSLAFVLEVEVASLSRIS